MGDHYASAGPEDRSLVGFAGELPKLTDHIDGLRSLASRYANAASDEQPIDPSVSEGLHDIARLLGAAQSIADALPAATRVGNEADFYRAENPRKGSASVEARADVQSAQRDQ